MRYDQRVLHGDIHEMSEDEIGAVGTIGFPRVTRQQRAFEEDEGDPPSSSNAA